MFQYLHYSDVYHKLFLEAKPPFSSLWCQSLYLGVFQGHSTLISIKYQWQWWPIRLTAHSSKLRMLSSKLKQRYRYYPFNNCNQRLWATALPVRRDNFATFSHYPWLTVVGILTELQLHLYNRSYFFAYPGPLPLCQLSNRQFRPLPHHLNTRKISDLETGLV